jgi:hypothetical protein
MICPQLGYQGEKSVVASDLHRFEGSHACSRIDPRPWLTHGFFRAHTEILSPLSRLSSAHTRFLFHTGQPGLGVLSL